MGGQKDSSGTNFPPPFVIDGKNDANWPAAYGCCGPHRRMCEEVRDERMGTCEALLGWCLAVCVPPDVDGALASGRNRLRLRQRGARRQGPLPGAREHR